MEANRKDGQNGNGHAPRPIVSGIGEWYLRNELWRTKDKKRKAEIEKILEEMK